MMQHQETNRTPRIPTEVLRSPEGRQIVDLLKNNDALRKKLIQVSTEMQRLLPVNIGRKLWQADYVDCTVAFLLTFFGEPGDPQLLAEALGLSLPIEVGTNDELRARDAVNLVFVARDLGKADALAHLALEKFSTLLSGATTAEPNFHPEI